MRSVVAQADRVAVPGYRVGERIGAGGFGEVFSAYHLLMDREVAIKVLHRRYSNDPDSIARFVAEARTVSKISHAGIVDVFDFGQLPDGRQYCVMELVRGTTLRDVLRERTRLPLAEALPILRAIAEAVDAAHGAGIAHRDLKPDNVFVLPEGGIKLIDFGLAKLLVEDTPVTQTGSVFGTPLYMSPEQCRGRAIDERTDAYSFGALAYHVLTGAPPFEGDALEIALRHLNDPPEPPSKRNAELGERVDRVVLALLAKDPAERPQSLIEAIDAIEGEAVLPAVPTPPRRSRAPWWIAFVAGAVGIGGFVIVQRTCVTPPGADEPCEPAEERLAGVWDDEVRTAAGAKFLAVKRVDVPSTWRVLSGQLDDYAGRWAKQWDAACEAPDRKTDPLLYVQRQTCLENALIDLHGISESLGAVDVAAFAEGWTGSFEHALLDDCESTAVLRSQLPAPKPEHRGEVTRLMMDMHRVRAAVRQIHMAARPGELDKLMAELEAIAKRLEELGSAGANTALRTRAFYLRMFAAIRPGGTEPSRKAIDDAIQRALASHDDQETALLYEQLATVEFDAGNTAAAEQAVERGEAASLRSGSARRGVSSLSFTRGRIEASRGNLEEALALFTNAPSIFAVPPLSAVREDLLLRLGRTAEGIALARDQVSTRQRLFGENHSLTAVARIILGLMLERSGDVAGALDESERVLAIYARLGASPQRYRELRMRQLGLVIRLGRSDQVDELARTIARGERAANVAPLTPAEWEPIAMTGYAIGSYEVQRLALAQFPAEGAPQLVHAFQTIQYALESRWDLIRKHARDILPDESRPDPAMGDPWLLAMADVHDGKIASAEARLAKLAIAHDFKHPPLRARAFLYDGLVLGSMQRWGEAHAAFLKARAIPIWIRDFTLAELDAWLGVTLFRMGDPAAARPFLEASIDTLAECCNGFHWSVATAELTLATILWDSGQDRPRARRLAAQSRDHSARLGPDPASPHPLMQTHASAARWLAEHPLP